LSGAFAASAQAAPASAIISVDQHCWPVSEHSRIFYFGNNGGPKIYSAVPTDAPQFLSARRGSFFPGRRSRVKKRVSEEIIFTYLADRVKAARITARRILPEICNRQPASPSPSHSLLSRNRFAQNKSQKLARTEKRTK